MKRYFLSLLFLVIAAATSPRASAAEKSASDLLPQSTVLYAEFSSPKEFADTVLDHPLRKQVESLDGYQRALESNQYLQFKAAVALVEAQLGMTWRSALESLTDGGVYLGIDSATKGAAVLVLARDENSLVKARDTFIKLARDDARNKNRSDPVQAGEYRGITAHKAGDARLAVLNRWLLVTNNTELGKQVVDNYLDDGGRTLAGSESFQKASRAVADEPTAWAYVDVAMLRDSDLAKDLFREKADNPLAELLIGGLLSNLRHTPFATAALYVRPQQLRLVISAPHEPDWAGQAREYYFGPGGRGTAPPLVSANQTLLALSTYRDVSQMWLRSDDLFDEKVTDGLAEADSNLSTLFSGRDFGQDILGAVAPEIQIVVARQDLDDVLPRPAIKLPAFALVFRLKDPEKMRGEFRRTFMSLVGFLNVVGAMNGQPQLDFEMQNVGEHQIVTAFYLPEAEEKDSKQARINFNFSPSVGFAGDRFIVSSTKRLVRELVDLLSSGQEPPDQTEVRPNTLVHADLKVLHDVLNDNRQQLVAQNMLQEGRTKEEAEKAIGSLLAIAGMFRDAALRLGTADDRLELEFAVNLGN